MGDGIWKSTDWDDFKRTATRDSSGRAKAADAIFARSGSADFDPKNITLRESCDAAAGSESTPVIIALDVTGSMGKIPDDLIKDGLGRMATEIIQRQPVSAPQIMFMAVGDAAHDRYPLQVTQFEADIRIAEQLKELHIEKGGGNNADESYHLPWYFAARKTKIDSFDKRGKKGILFTMGDEGVPPVLSRHHIKSVFGDDVQSDIKTEDLLRMVEERFEVFHLVIQQGQAYRYDPEYTDGCWNKLLGQRVLPVADFTKVPEIIVSQLELLAGKLKRDVVASWDPATALVVGKALSNVPAVINPSKGASTPAVWRPGMPKPG